MHLRREDHAFRALSLAKGSCWNGYGVGTAEEHAAFRHETNVSDPIFTGEIKTSVLDFFRTPRICQCK